MSPSIEVIARFPKALNILFKPARFKVLRGGRGSGKSWGVARAILLRCVNEKTRVLCTREIQKSIQQSVHQLLSDQIASLGLSSHFEVLEKEIRCANGSEIYFSGLSDITATTLKSFEGVDICWCEEAQTITEKSWKTLTPTIRKEGSEIWVTYNPELESDATHQRFVINPPPDCISVLMNYQDNPYFPKVLEADRAHAELTMKPEDYRHTWEGACKPAVEGAIYFDSMSQTVAANRIRNVPHDSSLRTHLIFDLGMADSMSIILAQKAASEIRVIHYIEGNQRILADYSAELKGLRLDDQPMNWGNVYLPHDGFAKKHQTGKQDAEIMQGLGWSVMQTPNTSVTNGIDRAREMFPRVYFHEQRAARLVESLKRYRWNISGKTGEAISPLHDEFSHACLLGDSIIKTRRGMVEIKDVCIGDSVWTPNGWSDVTNAGPVKYASALVEITAKDGKVLVCTPEHKVLTQKGFVRADELRYNDRVFNGQELPCILSKLLSMVTNLGFREVITGETYGEVLGHQTFIAQYGNFITALSSKGLKSITKTGIRSTTAHQISNACQCTFTSDSTCLNALNLDNCILRPMPRLQKQQSGTSQQTGKSGTARTLRQDGKQGSGIQRCVKRAARSISRLILRAPSFATSIAKCKRYECDEGAPLVYDLTVKKNSCYQANGLMVSNCDAFRYLAMNEQSLTNEDWGGGALSYPSMGAR